MHGSTPTQVELDARQLWERVLAALSTRLSTFCWFLCVRAAAEHETTALMQLCQYWHTWSVPELCQLCAPCSSRPVQHRQDSALCIDSNAGAPWCALQLAAASLLVQMPITCTYFKKQLPYLLPWTCFTAFPAPPALIPSTAAAREQEWRLALQQHPHKADGNAGNATQAQALACTLCMVECEQQCTCT